MKFGLVGYPLSHSFSPAYFNAKFDALGLPDFSYDLIPVPLETLLMDVLRADYFGLNITIPHKTSVINYLNDIDRMAYEVGAVNTLVRTGTYSWKGYNTDVTGFRESLIAWFADTPMPSQALVLGTGGAAKAVCYVLRLLGIRAYSVSHSGHGDLAYENISHDIISASKLIINATPLGMSPQTEHTPLIPFHFLTPDHWVYDLVYNPTNSLFLRRSEQMGAVTKNGLQMLHLQAEHAWTIWKSYGKF